MDYYALTRLILIDSYKPGTLQEVRLDGHTNLNGVNGAGKTTLLRLIPLFFGERPGRLVPRSRVTDSFAKHYLPHDSSYIIFEYRRGQQTCMVVIYASSNEEGLCYRFVDKGFDPGDFLETRLDGSHFPISCRDLKRHLDKRQVHCSPQLTSCNEYRTVIQNLHHSKGQEWRNLIARYSFCQGSAGRRLKDIEKIVSGMLQRSTDFDDLREMLVSCIDESRDSIALHVSVDKLNDWHKEYRAYQHSEAGRGQAAELREMATEQDQLKIRLGELHSRLLLLRERCRQRRQSLERQQSESEWELKSLQTAWEAQELDMKTALAGQRAELAYQGKQKLQLEAEKAQWDSKDIQHSIRLAGQLPLIEARLEGGQRHYGQLTVAVQDINAQFAAHKAETEKGYAEQRHQHDRQIQAVKSWLSQTEADLRSNHRQTLDRIRSDNHHEQEKLHEMAGQEQENLGRLNGQIEHVQADPVLMQAREAKLEFQQSLRMQLEQAKTAAADIKQRIKASQDTIETALNQKRQQQTEKQQIEQAIRHLHRQLDTDADTLLRFLREHQPSWVQDIAKVINPDLLLREDLEPGLEAKGTGLYGISLNLGVLPANLAADEHKIRGQIAGSQHRLLELADLDRQADQQLADLQKAGGQLRTQYRQAEAEQSRLQAGLGKAQTELSSLKQQIELSKRQRGQQLQAQKSAVTETLADIRQQLGALKKRQQDQERQLAAELDADLGRIRQEASQQIAQIQRDMASLDDQERCSLQQLEQQKTDRLKSRQIDVGALKQLEQRITSLKSELQAAKLARETVGDYRRWEQLNWSGYASLCNAIREQTANLQQSQAKLELEKRVYQQKSHALKATLEGFASDISKLTQDMQTLERLVDDSAAFSHHAPATVSFDESHNLALLQNEHRSLNEAYKSKRRILLTTLRHLKQTLSRYPATGPAKYYASQESELGLECDETAWLDPILHWYDAAHHDLCNWLINQANLFGTMIRDYQQALERFDRGVEFLSRQLAKQIDSNVRFDKIEKIRGHLASKVQTLDYWQQIVTFTKQYDEWNRGSERCLPSEMFAEIVRLVAEQMSGKGRMESKLVNLLELEIIVTENGRSKKATRAEELRQISSHGLSYLILCVFFIALVNMIRREQPLNIIWPMDELKELHQVNIEILMELLSNNRITLLSAFPDPDPDVLRLFKNRYQVVGYRELMEMEIDETYLAELEPLVRELANV